MEDPFRLTDDEAKVIIKKTTKCRTITDFQALDAEKRNVYIRKLHSKGLSIRQISRLTGVSKKIDSNRGDILKNNINIKRIKIFCIILLCLLVAIIPVSCHYARVPPGIRKVNRIYSQNEKEINTVLDFVRNAKYQSISIDDASGYMYADFKDVKINNADVEAAIKTLIEREDFGFIYKNKGSIEFKIWSYKDIRSYIVWSGDAVEPAVQYTTQIIPMKANGWNYVIADFYEWEKGQGDGLREP